MLDATKLPIVHEGTRLRPLSELDADAYASGTKDEAVLRFGHLPEPDYTPESVRRLIRGEIAAGLSSGTLAVLALADAATNQFVGSLVLFDVSPEAAEVGFWIHPDARWTRPPGARIGIAFRPRQWTSDFDGTHTSRERAFPAVFDQCRIPRDREKRRNHARGAAGGVAPLSARPRACPPVAVSDGTAPAPTPRTMRRQLAPQPLCTT